nr:hypothetical protein [Tanacetum cinerariifolium]
RDTTRTRPECEEDNEESGGSSKGSRTTENGDYSNPETPNSVASTTERPIGRDATKKKGKDSADYPNTQYHDNSRFFSNSSQVPVTQSPHSSQNTHDESRTSKWEAAEDVALMSAYVMVSEDATRGKNQKRESL